MMAERLAISEAKLLKMSHEDVVQTLVDTKMTLAQSEFQTLELQVLLCLLYDLLLELWPAAWRLLYCPSSCSCIAQLPNVLCSCSSQCMLLINICKASENSILRCYKGIMESAVSQDLKKVKFNANT